MYGIPQLMQFQLDTRNDPKLRLLTIAFFERVKSFLQKCQNNFETLDNFRPLIVGK